MMKYKKKVVEGKVAVLVSPGFGAGWSTWADAEHRKALMFDADLVDLVLQGKLDKVGKLAEERYGNYVGGVKGLEVHWLDEGMPFRIDEYDGYEYLITPMDMPYKA